METRQIGIAILIWVAVFTPLFVIPSVFFIACSDYRNNCGNWWYLACFGTIGSLLIATVVAGLSLMQVLKFPGKSLLYGMIGSIVSLPLYFLWSSVSSWRIFGNFLTASEALSAVLFPIVGQILATIAQLTCMFWPLLLGPIIYLWARRTAKKNERLGMIE